MIAERVELFRGSGPEDILQRCELVPDLLR